MAGILVTSILANGDIERPLSCSNVYIFNENISSQITNIQNLFKTNYKFIFNSTQIYFNSMRLTINVDYEELTNQIIKFFFFPIKGDTLIIDYVTL